MTSTVHAPTTADEVAQWLGSPARPAAVRLRAGGSRQDLLPEVPDAARLDLSRLDSIVRLDPGDQTCSVLCGLPRQHLDAALREHDLELPCLGGGTVGGLFASDPFGPAAGGALSPRSLLLGISAVLADGTSFRSGARVVKSVAGFDVHKLLVGSQGRLFVATQLHLRLKPRPRAEQWFCNEGLAVDEALDLVARLRQLALAPAVLQLRRARDGSLAVLGRIVGRSGYVADCVRSHGLTATDPVETFAVAARAGDEVLRGAALPSAVPGLLALQPDDTAMTWLGGGRFEVAVPTVAGSERLLDQLTARHIAAALVRAEPARRGRGTPIDPGQQRLADGIKNALDPDGILV